MLPGGNVDAPPTAKGQRAEQLAAEFLERSGFSIIERNYRCRLGEIDLIAEEKGVLCFIEVRSLLSLAHGHPFETINSGKRARLIRAVRHYLSRRGGANREMRFDAVSVVYQPERRIELIRGAFECDQPW